MKYCRLSIMLLLSITAAFADEFHHDIDPDSEHGRAHLKEELHGGPVNKTVEEMNSEELQFHYFRQHDYDHNDKLDGSELVVSLSHHHAQSQVTQRTFSDTQLISIIDEILKRHDVNNDGMMSFEEYVAPFKDSSANSEVKE